MIDRLSPFARVTDTAPEDVGGIAGGVVAVPAIGSSNARSAIVMFDMAGRKTVGSGPARFVAGAAGL